MSETAIVILNWNGLEFLKEYLPSVVENSPGKGIGIYVADNGSTDRSMDFVKDNFPEVRQVLLDRNYGFAQGYNLALEKIKADYFVLLNSDVKVGKGWLDPLIRLMDSNPLIAGCAPKLKDVSHPDFFEYAGASGGFIDRHGYAFCRGRIFDSLETDYGQYDDQRDVFWVTGACMMVRAELFKLSGGFDPYYFAHFEEIDFCWRMKNRGYRFMVVPSSLVWHLGGGTLPSSNPRKTYLNFRNNLFSIYKNSSPRKLPLTILQRLLLDGISAVRFLTLFRFGDFIAVIRAHFHFYGRIPALRTFRKTEKAYVKTFNHSEIYSGSIVKEYFLGSRKSFKSLKWKV